MNQIGSVQRSTCRTQMISQNQLLHMPEGSFSLGLGEAQWVQRQKKGKRKKEDCCQNRTGS